MRRYSVAALLVAAWVALPVAALADHLPEAEALLDDRRYEAAVPLLEAESRESPDNPRVWFLLGVAYSEQGDAQAADTAFRKALELDPAQALARYNLAILMFRAERWEEAAEHFLRVARERFSMAPAAYLNAGLARLKQGREDEARALFQEAVAADAASSSGKTAARMLAALEGRLPGAHAEGAVRGADSRPLRVWYPKASIAREYDSNVFASPDDPTTQNRGDQRTTVNASLARRFALPGERRLEARYSLFSRDYNKLGQSDLTIHTLRLRLERQTSPRRIRWEYALSSASLGGQNYLDTHTAGARWTLSRARGRATYLYLRGRVHHGATGYAYLGGRAAESALGHYRRLGAGSLYGSFTIEYLDRKDRSGASAAALGDGTATFVSYSYLELAPYVSYTRPFLFGTSLEVALRYRYHGYLDADVWNGGTTRRTRRDHKTTLDLTLVRELGDILSLEAGWRRDTRRSNIGDNPADYIDRDYDRNVYSIMLRADF